MALLMAERIEPPPSTLFGADADEDLRARRPQAGANEGPTLDDAVVAAWEGLIAHVAVACPVCDEGLLRPQPARHGVVGACCDGCGATLA
jgi:hypothetical protein